MKKLCLKIKLIKSNAAGKVINVFITTALFFIVSMFFSISSYAATISSLSDSLLPMTNKSLSASQLAAQRTADFSSVLNKLLKQPFDLGSSLNPIQFNKEDTQNFFSPVGSATVQPSSTGGWGTINLNNDESFKLGAVTLNTTIDMTKDFNFFWKVKISYSNYWDGPGDGIGFVLHPLYKPGDTITDQDTHYYQQLPNCFGRNVDNSPVLNSSDPHNGQNLNSIGIKGGNLGISDLMNAFGFKIDTYFNKYGSSNPPKNGIYGTNFHTDYNVYGQFDSSILNYDWQCPYGAFVTTNYNGYSTVDMSSYMQLNNPINIVNNQWWQMNVRKDGTSITVKISDPNNSSKYVSYSKNIAFMDNKTKYGFAIVASTGRVSESNQIKDIEGKFTPAQPTLVTRYTDENGTDLQDPKVTLDKSGDTNSNEKDSKFTDTNNKLTIYKDGKTYQCSQINGNLYDSTSDKPIIRQLTDGTKIGETPVRITKKDDTLTVSSQYNSVIVLNYIYRQRLPSGSTSSTSNSPITLGLKFRVNNNSSYVSSANIQPGDTITFQYTATNKSGPSLWQGVTAVQSLADILKPTDNLPTDVTSTSKLVYIPLLNTKNTESNNNRNNLFLNDSGTREVSFKYKGADKAKLTAQDGQITCTLPQTDSAPKNAPQAQITSKVAIYDQSQQLIDSDGNQLYGSYFYCSENDKSPLANPNPPDLNYTPDDLGNHIPATNIVKLNETLWWLVDGNGKLTIYPHNIDFNTKSAADWPWDSQRGNIKSVDIRSGVTAANSINSMFASMPHLTQIDLSNFDMSKVTDASAMFQDDGKLWKIILGPKVYLPAITDNPIMDAPGNNTPFPENNNYVSRSKNWKEVVGQDNDYKPTGPDKKASDFIGYQGNGSTRTYVWEPSLAGYLTLTSVPNQFDYGNNIMGIKQILTTAENQNFKVTDTRSLRAGLTWKVNVTASDLTSGDKQIKNNNESLFVLGTYNTPLGSSKTIINGTSKADTTEYSWSFTPEEGIKLNLQSNSVPKSGTYKGTINYELVNSV
ncbi:hypothetical protein GYT97_03100 [Lactobacillus mellis]|uniref:lectin-like domain-containing protein n=1 Tax=Bombilactobacillus mellis TaxID=1218508 RepID=UPI001580023E|nr:hypothetical protein [Bombilactobacillus mellis]NUG38865.1 hypothetical protein [Bombilactobacillus mellis]